MTDTVWPFEEAGALPDETALAYSHDLVDAIMTAEVSGSVMSLNALKQWLDQQ